MKLLPLSVLLGAFIPFSASAFTTTFPIGTYTAPGEEVNGLDGWTVSDVGSVDPAHPELGPIGHLAFVTTYLGSVAVGMGGVYNAPAAASPTSVFLSHAAPADLQTASFGVDFVIQASTENYPGRDGFGFAFRDATNANLLTISLVPVLSANMDAYQVRYTVGTGTTLDAHDGNGDPMYIYQYGPYRLDLAFTANGANPTFSASMAGTNTATFTGTATGLGSATIDRVGALWDVTDAGDNFLVIDNLSLVPEVSSSLLFCLAGIGFVSRRKRA